MQRDETTCVLDAGMEIKKKERGGEESKAAARCRVKGSGTGSSLPWQSVDSCPRFSPRALTPPLISISLILGSST